MKVTKEQTTELFSRALANAQGAGVKLILLSGDSDEKSEFVESCFSSFPFVRVNLGTELSRHLVESMSFSPGMETASFMRDIHSGEPLFCTHLARLSTFAYKKAGFPGKRGVGLHYTSVS